MSTVVFVCLHGSAKSLIAASYFTRFARERGLRYDAESMGLEPDPVVPEHVVAGLERDGFDVAKYRPKALNAESFASAACVVTFGCELPVTPHAYTEERWDDVPLVSDGFEQARDAIIARVRTLLEAIDR